MIHPCADVEITNMKKLLCGLLLLVSALAHSTLAGAASVVLGQAGASGVSAIISPDPGEIGRAANIWMGGVLNGTLYLRNGPSTWAEYRGGPYPIALTSAALPSTLQVSIVNIDISSLPGLDVYVGYGSTEADLSLSGHLAKVYTVPTQNSARALDGVARNIYDTLVAKQDLKPYISGVMTAFGVPPLGEADVATVDARFSQGLPLMFIPQVAEMADAFNDGGYISLDSFIASANAKGAKQKGTTNPLTRNYLTQKFAAFAGKMQYAPGQVLPAFVLALGKERARRFPPANPDPLWGDGLLDPLQLTLMLYAVSYSSAAPLPAQAPLLSVAAFNSAIVLASAVNPIEEFVKDQIKDQLTGELQDAVEIPLGEREAAQVSVCASLLLYGHKVRVTATPNLIYHRQTDGTAPWSTRVDALLTFEDDYWDNYLAIDRWMLNTLGNCTLPRRGPVEGKPIVWSMSDGLIAHGNYNITPAATDVDGKGVANWQTVVETTPLARRTFDNQRDAVGAAIVRAGSLVPGWSGLERIVGLLKDTGNTGDSPITVMYYVDPCRGEMSPAFKRANALVAPQTAAVCQDSWSGTSSSIITDAFPTYTISAQVTWVYDPSSGGNRVYYHPEGTVTFETLNIPCVSISPSSHQVTQTDGELEIDLSTNPPSYILSGVTGWTATYTDSCPGGGSFTAPAGGSWLSGQGSTTSGGNGIAGTFNNGIQTYTFSFTRN
jgi:hypothetical protein